MPVLVDHIVQQTVADDGVLPFENDTVGGNSCTDAGGERKKKDGEFP